jgi:hypothetical protein
MAINSMSFCHPNEHVIDRIKMITNARQAVRVNFMEIRPGMAFRCAPFPTSPVNKIKQRENGENSRLKIACAVWGGSEKHFRCRQKSTLWCNKIPRSMLPSIP